MRYDHYDKLETRDPDEREARFFRPSARPHRARAERAGLGAAARRRRSERGDLARGAGQAAGAAQIRPRCRCRRRHPPFGGFNVTAPGKVRRLLMSPGPIFEPEGKGRDFWGAARALFAAGFRPGDVVHNSFAYHLTPGGFIMESGAHALGCAVIPAGTGNTEQQLEAIAHLQPSGYLGTPDFLKILLDTAAKAGKDASSIKRGLVSRRGAAGLAAAGIGAARRRRAAVLRHRRARRHRLRERGERGHDRQRDPAGRDRAPRHRRSGRATARSARSSSPRSTRTIR